MVFSRYLFCSPVSAAASEVLLNAAIALYTSSRKLDSIPNADSFSDALLEASLRALLGERLEGRVLQTSKIPY